MLSNACFMLLLTLVPVIGKVVSPPMTRLMFPTFMPTPPMMGVSLGNCTLPLKVPLAPTPRYTVSLFLFAPPNAPSLTEEPRTMTLSVLFGRLSLSSSEPPK